MKRVLRRRQEEDRSRYTDSHEEHRFSPKRQRRSLKDTTRDNTSETLGSDSEDATGATELLSKRTYKQLSHVSTCGPAFPRSHYEGFQTPLPPSGELDALSNLEYSYTRTGEGRKAEDVDFSLDQFSIYRPSDSSRHDYALWSLDQLCNRDGVNELLFDGILSAGNERRYVEGIRFDVVSIDGYCDPDVIGLTDRMWIQSKCARKENVWYQLATASPEYQRFFEPFAWLATFAKFFVDFLLEHDNVALIDFRRKFYGFLYARHSYKPEFTSWLAQCSLRDFRTTVAAHVGYIRKECFGICNGETEWRERKVLKTKLLNQPIWGEVDFKCLSAIREQPGIEGNTIVTPFVHDCFRHMYFSNKLESRSPAESCVMSAMRERKRALGLTPLDIEGRREAALPTPSSMSDTDVTGQSTVHAGDVVTVWREPGGGWRSAGMDYAFVQRVRVYPGKTLLDVIWLYEPKDTTLDIAYYPFQNELFFSDNCNCIIDRRKDEPLDISEVAGIADVSFFIDDPSSIDGLFV